MSIPTPLEELEQAGSFYALYGVGYSLGALATEWLIGHAAASETPEGRFAPLEPGGLDGLSENDSYIRYYGLLPSSADWQEAFETAFGIAPGDFYEEFADYLSAFGGARLPHLADERDEPVLVVLGEVPLDAEAGVRAEFTRVQSFVAERFGGGTADYTVLVAADAGSAAPACLRLFGEAPDEGFCRQSNPGVYLLFVLSCGGSRHYLVQHHE